MQLAQVNVANASLLRDMLRRLPGVQLLRSGVHFNEFSVELPVSAAEFCVRMRKRGVFAGVPVAQSLVGHVRGLLIAVTETKSRADIESYARHAGACLEAC